MPSLSPEIWGPSTWRAIHYVALGYPSAPSEDDVAAYGAFFGSLQRVLPCESCANNYRRHLRELPIEPYLRSGRLFEWTVLLHNLVNRELGKAKGRGGEDWTPEQALSALSASKQQQGQDQEHRQQQFVVWAAVATVATVAAVAAVIVLYRTFSRSRRQPACCTRTWR